MIPVLAIIQPKCVGVMGEPTPLSASYAMKLAGTECAKLVGAINHPSSKWLTKDPALEVIILKIYLICAE